MAEAKHAKSKADRSRRMPSLPPQRSIAALAALGCIVLATGPAAAKTCKEPLTVTSRSTVKADEAARSKRATANAEKKWSKEARALYGVRYYFLFRADAKSVECRQAPKSTACTLTATPCSVL
jgi:hypothetical protein